MPLKNPRAVRPHRNNRSFSIVRVSDFGGYHLGRRSRIRQRAVDPPRRAGPRRPGRCCSPARRLRPARCRSGRSSARPCWAPLIGDGAWFTAGRLYGRKLIAALGRLSPAVDSKVETARSLFERFGVPLVSISKFVPGLGLITPPLMGTTAVDIRIYALWDLGGALAWATFWLLGGAAAERELHMLLAFVKSRGGTVFDILAGRGARLSALPSVQRRRARRRFAGRGVGVGGRGCARGRRQMAARRAADGTRCPPRTQRRPARSVTHSRRARARSALARTDRRRTADVRHGDLLHLPGQRDRRRNHAAHAPATATRGFARCGAVSTHGSGAAFRSNRSRRPTNLSTGKRRRISALRRCVRRDHTARLRATAQLRST